MFYRRKIILSLLQIFDNNLEKIRLQKLLFLFTKKQDKAEYHFVPYKYGCFSFSANADIIAMSMKGILSETNNYIQKKDNNDYIKQLKPLDKSILHQIKDTYGKMNTQELIKYTYTQFPFYAIRSELQKNILNKEEIKKINHFKPKRTNRTLYTIGYEGVSIEEYLVRLINNDVKVLVDVRNNPISMKYGFSKYQLSKYCKDLDIEYIHIPELGILSELRQNLNTPNDYDNLFANYRKHTLPKAIAEQKKVLSLLKQYKRVALTCFEANIHQCHRKHLANSIASFPEFNYEVKHI